MSSLSHYLILPYLLFVFVASIALNVPQNPDSLTLASNYSYIPNITNISESTNHDTSTALSLLDSTLTAMPKVICEPSIYGHPPAASCREAVSQIPNDPATILRNPKLIIGPRDLGQWDVPLPKRFISSDGQCIVDYSQTGLFSGVEANDILTAGTFIQQYCLEASEPPWGGRASRIGDQANFNVTVQAYRPPFVRCNGAPPSKRPDSRACETILNTMKASTEQTAFGLAGIAGVEERLPQTLTEPSGGCTITIDITVSEDQASWYDLWAAAVALDGMCARGRKTGQARFLGSNRKLVMQIKKLL